MLEAPERTGAAEAGLDLIEDEQGAVAVAPLPQGLDVLRRCKGGGTALVGFQHDRADLAGRHAVFGQGSLEELEAGVLGPVAVGEWDLDEAGIEVADPLLQDGDAAYLLGAERAAVEGLLERDDDVLGASADLVAVDAGDFDGELDSLGAGGEQKDLLQRLRHEADEAFAEFGANGGGEAVVREQSVLRLGADRVGDLFAAVAGVGDEDAGRPVEPLVAPGVVDLEAFGAVPDDGRLAGHGAQLEVVQLLENGE
ncbi:MAG: hypothetical protein QM757_24585 [Paludibaculum sp.]